MEKLKILLLEDNDNDTELIKNELLLLDTYEVEVKRTIYKDEFSLALIEFMPDIILSDYNLPQFNGIDALNIAKEKLPLIPFIIVTGTLSEESAADCIKSGAWDYVVKERLTRLPIAIKASLVLKSEKMKLKQSETELKLIKESLGIQLKLLYDSIDKAPSSIVITDTNGAILYVNPTFEKITGYSKKEVLGGNPRILKSGYQDMKTYKELWDTLLAGKEWRGELLNKKKNGDLYWEDAIIAPIIDENKKIVNFVAIKNDISTMKSQEEKLLKSENFYKAIFENTGNATCIIEENGLLSLVNSSFEELSGFSKEELEEKKKIYDFIPSSKIEKTIQFYYQKKEELDLNNKYEINFINKNNERKNIILIVDKIESTNKLVASLIDITERKNAEIELKKAKEKAEESVKLKSTFISSMSHELRTPLNIILGFSSLIEEETSLEEIYSMAKAIKDSGNDLLSIIEAVFDISMLQARASKINKEHITISDIFSKFNYYLSTEQTKKNKENINIYFKPEINSENLVISTDRTLVTQVITNLLNNALKFTNQGNIEYGYTINNNDITFFVKDSGIGIPNDKIDIIFDKFRQVDDSHSRKYGGVGLGLAICKEIALLLDGKIWVESEEGKGSVFYFYLPNVLQLDYLDEKKQNEGIVIPNLENKLILIVEDIELNYFLLLKMLLKTKAKIIWAKNGEEAVRIVKEKPEIDIILMDIRMPKMNGYDATVEIRKFDSNVYIIAQTAYALDDEKENIFHSGCNDYISKPINKKLLYNKLTNF
ncbi:MAG: PAS domain S-box protein [Candidatus Sericytochromatia bacterium]